MKLDVQDNWIGERDAPILVAGPCSAETEEQLHTVIQQLAEIGRINLLRAGIWKPRTRPNSFEGVGTKGLEWLKEAAKSVGLPSCTEVANRDHVEQALKAGIDVLWIGARTTVNPFSVQEIADVLKGVDIPVMVKNPINPDLELWLGALERINNAGVSKLAAIHRGFSGFEKTAYRNSPKWDIPIELKRRLPNLPIICDPSHIGGNRDLIPMISQKALDLDFNGLMIEVHSDPDHAWSDAKQQITPQRLNEILDALIVRKKDVDNVEFRTKLEKLRDQIDSLDAEILEKLSARFKIIQEIGQEKRLNGVTILQVDRWDEIIANRKQLANQLGMSEEFIDRLLKVLHKESIGHQIKVMN